MDFVRGVSMSEDSYRRVAGVYDKLFEPMNRGLRLIGLKMFRPDKGMTVLDVGCGTGVHLEVYQRSGCELFGIDISQSMLDVARTRLGEDADLRLADVSDIPFGSHSFDLVISMLVLHEMDQAARPTAIEEMIRVLKVGGRMLLIDFHPGPIRSIKCWLTKSFILLSEIAAGRRHFRNYRHFISIRGLPALIEASNLSVEQQKVVGGGAMALYLVHMK